MFPYLKDQKANIYFFYKKHIQNEPIKISEENNGVAGYFSHMAISIHDSEETLRFITSYAATFG